MSAAVIVGTLISFWLLFKLSSLFRYVCKIIMFVIYLNVAAIGLMYSIIKHRQLRSWKHMRNTAQIAAVFRWLLGIEVEFRDRQYLSQNPIVVFMVNHQNILDILIMISFMPERALILAKQHNRRQLFFSSAIHVYDSLYVDRDDRQHAIEQLKDVAGQLQQRQLSLWSFPEGRRNYTNPWSLLPFKKGVFHLAVEGQYPIVPVVYSSFLSFYEPMKRFDEGKVIARCLPPISTTGLTMADVDALVENVHQRMLNTLIELDNEVAAQRR